MINLFRSNTIFSQAALLLFVVLLRLPSFMTHHSLEPALNTPFAEVIFRFLSAHSLFLHMNEVLAALLLFIHAILINYITGSHEILYKDSVLPGLFYVILNSIYPEQQQLTPQLVSNTFLILLFNRLCYLYESDKPLFLAFDAGILLGMGILLDYDLFVYLPFILISVLYMTSINLRYWLVVIIGILIPAYFLGVVFYLTNHLYDFLVSFEYSIRKSYFNPIGINWREGAVWVFFAFGFAASLLELQSNFLRNKVKTRRVQLIVIILFAFGIISVLAENQGYFFGLVFLATALSVLLSNYFVRTKSFWLKEILFAGILVCIIYYQLIAQ